MHTTNDQEASQPANSLSPSSAPESIQLAPSETFSPHAQVQASHTPRTVLTAEHIEAAASALRTLRPLKPLTTRDALVKLAPQIKAAQQRGCTFDQLSEQLRACGIDASVSSLRRSLREAAANGKPDAKAAT